MTTNLRIFFLIFLSLTVSKSEKISRISSPAAQIFFSQNNTELHRNVLLELASQIGSFLDSMHSNKDVLLRIIEADTLVDPQDQKCLDDIEQWTLDKKNFQMYALQMQDSWATREGGMLEGNVRWSGHYWECINSISDTGFKGKYCTTYYGGIYMPFPWFVPVDIAFDSCFPDSCSKDMIKMLTEEATKPSIDGDIDIRAPVQETRCSPQHLEDPYNAFTIFIIVVSAIFLLLALWATFVDIHMRSKKNSDCSHWLLCFSVLKNGEKILSTRQPPKTISAINGIRTISTFWVILGHSLAMVITLVDNTVIVGQEVRARFALLVILNGTYSVDTFFCIAGLLTCYLTLKQLKKTKGDFNIPMMYLHRYLRLTPLLAYVMIFTIGAYKLLGSGPHWVEYATYVDQNCANDWWTVLLYINNLYPALNYCFGHAWYLACDMQFYLLSPIFIYLLYKYPKVGISATFAVLLTSIGVTWWISQSSNQQPMAVFNAQLYSIVSRILPALPVPETNETSNAYIDKFTTDMYFTPWCRISVYMVGLLAGYILHKSQLKLKMSKLVVFIGWLLSVGVGLSLVYGLYGATSEPHNIKIPVAAFYNAVSRPLWGCCVAWIIIACTTGYGGPVTTFLNWTFFIPMSRLGYAAYLIHLYVMYWYVGTSEYHMHYSAVWLTYSFIGHVFIAYGLAFLAAVLIEWPCQEIVKLLLIPTRKNEKEEKIDEISLGKPPSYKSDLEKIEENIEEDGCHDNQGRDNLAFQSVSTKI